MRYSAEDPYKLLTESGLPYVATERFALDQLLGRQVRNIDIYVVYICEDDTERWRQYLNGKATEKSSLANLSLHPEKKSSPVFKNGPLAPLETLARDIVWSAPRYLVRRHREISEQAPELYAKILELYPPDFLNFPDTAPKVA